MSLPVHFGPEAEEELSAAVTFYEERREGLGVALLLTVDHAVAALRGGQLSRYPLVPEVSRSLGVRRLLLRRFPFAIVFVELADEIRVLAVAHTSRRPGYWRDRLG